MDKDLKAQWLKTIVCYDGTCFVEIEGGLLTLTKFETGKCLSVGRGHGLINDRFSIKRFKATYPHDATTAIKQIIRTCLLLGQDWMPLYKASATQALRKELSDG